MILLLKMIKVKIAIFFILPIFVGNTAYGFLKVNGDKVLDHKGKIVILKGFNVEFKDFKTVLDKQDIKKIAQI